ncbi:hypothetical protein JTE90_004872 [Oedothorax gibbosus]|uniref:Uncharacterized protein n=1 Tax=Oedothorax gibbosus TaxID=931172 RepID=A0AAV6UV48_9ARAC|nr:hypothetical protein JTE90_004872 [Oedothorax gibbosus]
MHCAHVYVEHVVLSNIAAKPTGKYLQPLPISIEAIKTRQATPSQIKRLTSSSKLIENEQNRISIMSTIYTKCDIKFGLIFPVLETPWLIDKASTKYRYAHLGNSYSILELGLSHHNCIISCYASNKGEVISGIGMKACMLSYRACMTGVQTVGCGVWS